MDLNGTTLQVQGVRFRFCKFVDLSGTSGQVRGPLVYLTLLPKRGIKEVRSSALLQNSMTLLYYADNTFVCVPECMLGLNMTQILLCFSS